MSYIEKSGIEHNSFYETDSDLGIETKSERELREYKRLIGMPLADDYDELISSLKDEIPKKKEFSEYDFIRLFLSLLLKNGVVKIDTVKLSRYLINFYQSEEFKDILVMPVKRQIEGDFVDLSECINQAHLYGLLSNPIQSSNERLILYADLDEIISCYDGKTIFKINGIVEEYIKFLKHSTESSLGFNNDLVDTTVLKKIKK